MRNAGQEEDRQIEKLETRWLVTVRGGCIVSSLESLMLVRYSQSVVPDGRYDNLYSVDSQKWLVHSVGQLAVRFPPLTISIQSR